MEGQWCLPLAYWEMGVLGLINNLQQHYHQKTDSTFVAGFYYMSLPCAWSDQSLFTFELVVVFLRNVLSICL